MTLATTLLVLGCSLFAAFPAVQGQPTATSYRYCANFETSDVLADAQASLQQCNDVSDSSQSCVGFIAKNEETGLYETYCHDLSIGGQNITCGEFIEFVLPYRVSLSFSTASYGTTCDGALNLTVNSDFSCAPAFSGVPNVSLADEYGSQCLFRPGDCLGLSLPQLQAVQCFPRTYALYATEAGVTDCDAIALDIFGDVFNQEFRLYCDGRVFTNSSTEYLPTTTAPTTPTSTAELSCRSFSISTSSVNDAQQSLQECNDFIAADDSRCAGLMFTDSTGTMRVECRRLTTMDWETAQTLTCQEFHDFIVPYTLAMNIASPSTLGATCNGTMHPARDHSCVSESMFVNNETLSSAARSCVTDEHSCIAYTHSMQSVPDQTALSCIPHATLEFFGNSSGCDHIAAALLNPGETIYCYDTKYGISSTGNLTTTPIAFECSDFGSQDTSLALAQGNLQRCNDWIGQNGQRCAGWVLEWYSPEKFLTVCVDFPPRLTYPVVREPTCEDVNDVLLPAFASQYTLTNTSFGSTCDGTIDLTTRTNLPCAPSTVFNEPETADALGLECAARSEGCFGTFQDSAPTPSSGTVYCFPIGQLDLMVGTTDCLDGATRFFENFPDADTRMYCGGRVLTMSSIANLTTVDLATTTEEETTIQPVSSLSTAEQETSTTAQPPVTSGSGTTAEPLGTQPATTVDIISNGGAALKKMGVFVVLFLLMN